MSYPLLIDVPAQPELMIMQSRIIASGLNNPRGMVLKEDGSVLLLEAGTGDQQQPFSGRVLAIKPQPNNLGRYLPPTVFASGFRSTNMQHLMNRDEIMGLSDIALADNQCFISYTDYVDGSKIFDLNVSPPEPVFYSQGNINSLCYHPKRRSWFSVKPDTNQIIEFVHAQQNENVLVDLPALSAGQEAIPVTLVYEPQTQALLVSLFSGELKQTPDKKGIDFAMNAGQVIRFYPETKKIETVIRGLNLPTGLALMHDRCVLVSELCEKAVQPLTPQWQGEPLHGGFQRFSGRLLRCCLDTGSVQVLATGLDTPSNLCVAEGSIFISEGMGVPNRLIPHPEKGTIALTGYIRLLRGD